MAIVENRTGDSHVNANVPARRSAPSTASPITRHVSGTTSPNRPCSATTSNASSAETSASVPSQANSNAPRQGSTTPHQRRAGRQARNV